jgi:hypothetical protein
MKAVAVIFGLLMSAATIGIGAYLCYANKDGWGWFVFIGFLMAGGFSNYLSSLK